MALTTCPECGKAVSTSASSCPHCGHAAGPGLGAKIGVSLTRIMLLLLALAAVGFGLALHWSGYVVAALLVIVAATLDRIA